MEESLVIDVIGHSFSEFGCRMDNGKVQGPLAGRIFSPKLRSRQIPLVEANHCNIIPSRHQQIRNQSCYHQK